MTGLLQCFAGKPNTFLLYIAGLFTLCMTARVKSHDSRYMGGQTHTHTCTYTQAEGVEAVREREELYWVGSDVLLPRDLTPICSVSPSVSRSVSVDHMLISFLFDLWWAVFWRIRWIDNHCASDHYQQLLCVFSSKQSPILTYTLYHMSKHTCCMQGLR